MLNLENNAYLAVTKRTFFSFVILPLKADAVSRTFDYEPFFREFITELHNEGLLAQCIGAEVTS